MHSRLREPICFSKKLPYSVTTSRKTYWKSTAEIEPQETKIEAGLARTEADRQIMTAFEFRVRETLKLKIRKPRAGGGEDK